MDLNPETGEQMWQPADGGPPISAEDWRNGVGPEEAPPAPDADAADAEPSADVVSEGTDGAEPTTDAAPPADVEPDSEPATQTDAESAAEPVADAESVADPVAESSDDDIEGATP